MAKKAKKGKKGKKAVATATDTATASTSTAVASPRRYRDAVTGRFRDQEVREEEPQDDDEGGARVIARSAWMPARHHLVTAARRSVKRRVGDLDRRLLGRAIES